MIRLLLVDDQILVRQGLKVLMEAQPDLQVIGEAENGQQAIALVEKLNGTSSQPDVVLMDIRMPEMDGVAATQMICQRFADVKVLVLSTFDDDDYVARAMKYGAKGYLLKDSHPEELAQAIRAVYRGYTQLAPGLFEKAIAQSASAKLIASPPPPASASPTVVPPQLAKLTSREREVLCLIIAGSTNREIAQSLYISERTVKNHVTSILNRLNLRDRLQAAMFASDFLPFLGRSQETDS
jgi:DNA-binding NarL/FixJ family response regulator